MRGLFSHPCQEVVHQQYEEVGTEEWTMVYSYSNIETANSTQATFAVVLAPCYMTCTTHI